MPATPALGLRYPALGDAPNVPSSMQALAEDVEAKLKAKASAGAFVYRAVDAGINTSTETAINFDAEVEDALGMHDMAANLSRLTVPAGYAGIWKLTGQAAFATNNVGFRYIRIRRNGVPIAEDRRRGVDGGGTWLQVVSPDIRAAAGDYFEMVVFQNSGVSPLIVAGGVANTFLSATFVGV